jgi:plastocyanin
VAGGGSAFAAPSMATAPNYAAYTGTGVAKKVSATVTVPTVDCSGVARGTYAGQSIGVHLSSGGLQVTSDVRAYCHGATAVYTAEQAVPINGGERFSPASITIAPGDKVRLVVSTNAQGTTASAEVSSGGTSQGSGTGGPHLLPNGMPYFVATTISANKNGAPLQIGKPPAGNPVIAGPVASTSVKVTAAKVNGLPLAQLAGLEAVRWVDSGNQPLVTPTAVHANGTGFSLNFTVS